MSLDSAAATAFATARRMPHMGGIAAGTQPQALMTVREGLPGDSEPDIDLTEEPETPASETDSEDGGALLNLLPFRYKQLWLLVYAYSLHKYRLVNVSLQHF